MAAEQINAELLAANSADLQASLDYLGATALRIKAERDDLLAALTLLLSEVVASGNADATDFGWKNAVDGARAAIARAMGVSHG